MEAHEFMTNFNVKPADVLNDKIGERGDNGSRKIRLSFDFEYRSMIEYVADLGLAVATLYRVDFNPDESEGEKALETFRLNAEQMDTLAASWIQFRSDVQTKVELFEAKQAQERAELIQRAAKLGATLTVTDEEYYCFTIEWDAEHKHYDIYRGNQGLSFADVKQRLDNIEEEISNGQNTRN